MQLVDGRGSRGRCLDLSLEEVLVGWSLGSHQSFEIVSYIVLLGKAPSREDADAECSMLAVSDHHHGRPRLSRDILSIVGCFASKSRTRGVAELGE